MRIQKILLSAVCMAFMASPALAQSLCDSGKAQSPINIDKYAPVDVLPLGANYKNTPLDLVNNGQTIQMFFELGSTLRAGGRTFDLHQMEIYTPSEHYLNGAPYPMELQFVHRSKDWALGILSVFVKVGEQNKYIQGLLDNVPMEGKRHKIDSVKFSAADLLPENKGYYTYEGSLSVAPCTEGVQWYVMKEPIEMSAMQLRTFEKMFPRNARMIQPLNGRVVKGSK